MTRHVSLSRVLAVMAMFGALAVRCSPTPPPTPSLPPAALLPVEVTGVGAIPPGRTSLPTMTIRLTEADVATIARGEGSLVITFTDSAGAGDSIGLIGEPAVSAPGSLGVTAGLSRPSVIVLSIVDSDPLNIEQVTISNLRLSASAAAAAGPIRATITECTGSLAGCAPERELASPGTVGEPGEQAGRQVRWFREVRLPTTDRSV
jgi:hypothetical protein